MTRDCPLCEGASEARFRAHGFWIKDCLRCHHRFAELQSSDDHVGRVYGDDYFQSGGAGYPNYLAEAPILAEHGRRYATLMARFTAPGRVLDVGAAAGFLLSGLVEKGWSGCGVEPNASMAAFARERLDLCVVEGTLESFGGEERFDLVSFIQVLPHFLDPRRALERASSLTKDGGFWLIETWDRDSWTARLSGRRWHEYSPPSVLHWFTPDSVARLAAGFGFREVARGRPSKRLSAAHAKSLLKYKLGKGPFSGWCGSLLDVVPDAWSLPYPAEDLFWLICRKDLEPFHAS